MLLVIFLWSMEFYAIIKIFVINRTVSVDTDNRRRVIRIFENVTGSENSVSLVRPVAGDSVRDTETFIRINSTRMHGLTPFPLTS